MVLVYNAQYTILEHTNTNKLFLMHQREEGELNAQPRPLWTNFFLCPAISYHLFFKSRAHLTLSGETLSGEIFIGRNYSSGEIFVTFQKIRHFRLTKFRPLRYCGQAGSNKQKKV